MTMLPDTWMLPELTSFNAAWFTSGALAIQRCTKCATLQHPPEEICHACGAMTFDTVTLAPRGTVASYTVVHYAANRALADAVPYTVVLVSLDDAPHLRVVLVSLDDAPHLRVVGNLEGDGVHIGMAVVPYWEEHTAEDGTAILLPQWRPA